MHWGKSSLASLLHPLWLPFTLESNMLQDVTKRKFSSEPGDNLEGIGLSPGGLSHGLTAVPFPSSKGLSGDYSSPCPSLASEGMMETYSWQRLGLWLQVNSGLPDSFCPNPNSGHII